MTVERVQLLLVPPLLLQGLEPFLALDVLAGVRVGSLVLLLLPQVHLLVLGLEVTAEMGGGEEPPVDALLLAGGAGELLHLGLNPLLLPPVDGVLMLLEVRLVREAGTTVAAVPDQLVDGGDVAGEVLLLSVADSTDSTLEGLAATVDGGHVPQQIHLPVEGFSAPRPGTAEGGTTMDSLAVPEKITLEGESDITISAGKPLSKPGLGFLLPLDLAGQADGRTLTTSGEMLAEEFLGRKQGTTVPAGNPLRAVVLPPLVPVHQLDIHTQGLGVGLPVEHQKFLPGRDGFDHAVVDFLSQLESLQVLPGRVRGAVHLHHPVERAGGDVHSRPRVHEAQDSRTLRVGDLPGVARHLGLLAILHWNESSRIGPEQESPWDDVTVVDDALSRLPDVAGLHLQGELFPAGEDGRVERTSSLPRDSTDPTEDDGVERLQLLLHVGGLGAPRTKLTTPGSGPATAECPASSSGFLLLLLVVERSWAGPLRQPGGLPGEGDVSRAGGGGPLPLPLGPGGGRDHGQLAGPLPLLLLFFFPQLGHQSLPDGGLLQHVRVLQVLVGLHLDRLRLHHVVRFHPEQ